MGAALLWLASGAKFAWTIELFLRHGERIGSNWEAVFSSSCERRRSDPRRGLRPFMNTRLQSADL